MSFGRSWRGFCFKKRFIQAQFAYDGRTEIIRHRGSLGAISALIPLTERIAYYQQQKESTNVAGLTTQQVPRKTGAIQGECYDQMKLND